MTNLFQVSKTAAVAIVGANLFSAESWKSVKYPRKLASIAVVGSTNINDFAVEIFAGQRKICTLYNTAAGANVIPTDNDKKYPAASIFAGEELQCIVIDAAAGNPVVIQVQFNSAKSRPYRGALGYNRGFGTYGRTNRNWYRYNRYVR